MTLVEGRAQLPAFRVVPTRKRTAKSQRKRKAKVKSIETNRRARPAATRAIQVIQAVMNQVAAAVTQAHRQVRFNIQFVQLKFKEIFISVWFISVAKSNKMKINKRAFDRINRIDDFIVFRLQSKKLLFECIECAQSIFFDSNLL